MPTPEIASRGPIVIGPILITRGGGGWSLVVWADATPLGAQRLDNATPMMHDPALTLRISNLVVAVPSAACR